MPVQSGVDFAQGEELRVRAAFDDSPVVEHENQVRLPDGAEPVGDDKAGATLQKGREGPLNAGLGQGINRARGLIKDEDAGIGQQGAGEGNELSLIHI